MTFILISNQLGKYFNTALIIRITYFNRDTIDVLGGWILALLVLRPMMGDRIFTILNTAQRRQTIKQTDERNETISKDRYTSE